jgi:hypothetical protein
MTNPPPQINISSLDFEGLKESFKNYLKTLPNSELNSYDYQGSAINLLLDVFAYNTLYYAYYANMLANESFLATAQIENNFVSLLKPLGVLLPSRTCSVAEITASSISSSATVSSYSDIFLGTSNNGLVYRFYTIDDIELDVQAKSFKVYEASSVVKDLTVSVDLTEQKAFIATKNLDISTLKIKVNSGGVEREWELANNTSSVGPDAKVYFIDRTATGFYIVFGKRSINDFDNNYGKNIEAGDTVTVSYLVPNGESANNVGAFSTSALINISSVVLSSGGRSSPDLEAYRFSAPKLFAANDRAITKDDYYGLLLNSGLLPPDITSKEEINVWGGEEANPPATGRVFMSFANEGLTAGSYSVKNCISYIKRKCPLTILPEYAQPQIITANIYLSVVGTSINNTAIKNLINDYYNTNYIFNNTIFLGDLRSLIRSRYTVTGINLNSITLSLDAYGSVTDRVISYNTPFASSEEGSRLSVVKTTGITYMSESVLIGDVPTKFNRMGESVEGKLYAFKSTNTNIQVGTNSVGYVDYEHGLVTIRGGILPETQTTTITVVPKNQDGLVFNNQFLLKSNATINGV